MFDLVCLFPPLIKVIWIQSVAAALKLSWQSLSVALLASWVLRIIVQPTLKI